VTAQGSVAEGHAYTEHYTATFDRIRASIDAVIQPWRQMPDPGALLALLESSNTVCSHLSTDEIYRSPAGGNYSSGGELKSGFGALERNLDGLTGTTGQRFAMKYLDRLPNVVSNISGLAQTLSGVLYGQHAIWSAAPDDLKRIVAMSRDQMKHLSSNASQPDKVTLAVVGFAAEALKLFVPGAVAKAVSLGTAAIGAAEKGGLAVTAEGGNYDEALANFADSVDQFNSGIRSEEQALRSILYAVTDHAMQAANRADYDVPDGVNNLPHQPGTSHGWNQDKIEAMAGIALPALAAELDAVADNVQQLVSVSHVDRDASIGLGAHGPHPAVQRFGGLVHNLLEEAAADALNGAVQLKEALSDFQRVEADIMDELNRINADLLGARDYGEDLGGDLGNITKDAPKGSPVDDRAAGVETIHRLTELMGG